MIVRTTVILLCTLFLIVIMTACGEVDNPKAPQPNTVGQTEGPPPAAPQQDSKDVKEEKPQLSPAELVVFGAPSDPANVFDERIGDAVRKKFPHYTITYIQKGGGDHLQKMISAGDQLDMVYDSIGGFASHIIDHGLQYDISQLVKQQNIDLSRFQPAPLESITSTGGLYGFPIHGGGLVLYYNKDIFEKFGAPYPTDGMFWDDAIELGNLLTRKEGDIQYIGLGLSPVHALSMNPFSLPLLDFKTFKPMVNNDAYKKIVEMLVVRPAQDAGYKNKIAVLNRTFNNDDFMKEQTMGMFVMNYGLQTQQHFETFDWDMTAVPVFKDNPGVGTQPYPAVLSVATTSKHKEQAIDVLDFLTSDEYQMSLSRRGYIPVVDNKEIQDAFGSELSFSDKNIVNAIFYFQMASPAPRTKFDNTVYYGSAFLPELVKVITGGTDLNSALRTIEEVTEKAIEAALQQQK